MLQLGQKKEKLDLNIEKAIQVIHTSQIQDCEIKIESKHI